MPERLSQESLSSPLPLYAYLPADEYLLCQKITTMAHLMQLNDIENHTLHTQSGKIIEIFKSKESKIKISANFDEMFFKALHSALEELFEDISIIQP